MLARQQGQMLPTPASQENGGYAYEMLYLGFRVRPEPYLMGEELNNFIRENLQPQAKTLAMGLRATKDDYLAYYYARDLLEKYNRYGMPREGGYMDQDYEWIIVMDCILTARERAESLTEREEAWFNKERNKGAAANG